MQIYGTILINKCSPRRARKGDHSTRAYPNFLSKKLKHVKQFSSTFLTYQKDIDCTQNIPFQKDGAVEGANKQAN